MSKLGQVEANQATAGSSDLARQQVTAQAPGDALVIRFGITLTGRSAVGGRRALRASFVAGASCGPALQVPAVPEGAAMASCEHACDLVRVLGESGWKARPRSGGAQVLHRVLPVCFGAVCGLPVARSESAFARHAPAQPCAQRRCAAYGERCPERRRGSGPAGTRLGRNGQRRRPGQRLRRPGGPVDQSARDDALVLARVPVRAPRPQDASGGLRSRRVPPALGRARLKV